MNRYGLHCCSKHYSEEALRRVQQGHLAKQTRANRRPRSERARGATLTWGERAVAVRWRSEPLRHFFAGW
jgi:hypothetical protein